MIKPPSRGPNKSGDSPRYESRENDNSAGLNGQVLEWICSPVPKGTQLGACLSYRVAQPLTNSRHNVPPPTGVIHRPSRNGRPPQYRLTRAKLAQRPAGTCVRVLAGLGTGIACRHRRDREARATLLAPGLSR